MTPDGWVWAALGLLLALLGVRAWVVETGHASLGRTPVRVKVLTAACALALALVAGSVAVNGGARLVWMVLHPAEAEALEDAADDASTAPPGPAADDPAAPGAPGAGAPTASAVPAAPGS